MAEAAYDTRVDTERGVRAADEKEPVMSEPITYVGIDAHKAQLQVAVVQPAALGRPAATATALGRAARGPG